MIRSSEPALLQNEVATKTFLRYEISYERYSESFPTLLGLCCAHVGLKKNSARQVPTSYPALNCLQKKAQNMFRRASAGCARTTLPVEGVQHRHFHFSRRPSPLLSRASRPDTLHGVSRHGTYPKKIRNGQSTVGGPKWTKNGPFWSILVSRMLKSSSE